MFLRRPHGVPLEGPKEVHTTRTFLRVSLNPCAIVLQVWLLLVAHWSHAGGLDAAHR